MILIILRIILKQMLYYSILCVENALMYMYLLNTDDWWVMSDDETAVTTMGIIIN